MSLSSMTGFGRGVSRRNGYRVEVEISSVNRKQFDLQVHLPRELQVMESRIQDEIIHVITRGRISVALRVEASGTAAARRVRVNRPLAEAYVRAIRSASADLGLPDALDNRLFYTLPDLLIADHPEEDADRIWPVLLASLRRAIVRLLSMRRSEGRALSADIGRRAGLMSARIDAIARLAPQSAKAYRNRIIRRLEEARIDSAGHEDRIAREIAVFAERADICEEIARIRSHLLQVRKLLRGSSPAGRSLDFLAQEMGREINTLGAKACDGEISANVVEFKAELERMREQVQNVE